MPSPFRGMDPYLEHPFVWPGLHHRLITAIADEVSTQLNDRYYVDIEQRVYLSESEEPDAFRIPDVSRTDTSGNGDAPTSSLDPAFAESEVGAVAVKIPLPEEVRESYLEVREGGSDYLITAIELLSPTNKRRGRGRQLYEDKRLEMLGTRTNLVEIDLLRAGEPMRILGDGIHSDYRILVARGGKSRAMLYPFGVRQRIPKFSVPLRRGDAEPIVDIGRLMPDIYDHARYYMRLDYSTDPVPPLSDSDTEWADELLRSKALR